MSKCRNLPYKDIGWIPTDMTVLKIYKPMCSFVTTREDIRLACILKLIDKSMGSLLGTGHLFNWPTMLFKNLICGKVSVIKFDKDNFMGTSTQSDVTTMQYMAGTGLSLANEEY